MSAKGFPKHTRCSCYSCWRQDDLREAIEDFLVEKCAVKAVQVVGASRRRVEVVEEISFVIETDDLAPSSRIPALWRRPHARAC